MGIFTNIPLHANPITTFAQYLKNTKTKTIVIASTFYSTYHNLTHKDMTRDFIISGSEINAYNTAIHFQKRKYNVIFLSNNKTTQLVDGILYMSIEYMQNVLSTIPSIDIYMCMRQTTLLRYGDHIKRVILVLDDVLPIGSAIPASLQKLNGMRTILEATFLRNLQLK
jgi:hypothetical protein